MTRTGRPPKHAGETLGIHSIGLLKKQAAHLRKLGGKDGISAGVRVLVEADMKRNRKS